MCLIIKVNNKFILIWYSLLYPPLQFSSLPLFLLCSSHLVSPFSSSFFSPLHSFIFLLLLRLLLLSRLFPSLSLSSRILLCSSSSYLWIFSGRRAIATKAKNGVSLFPSSSSNFSVFLSLSTPLVCRHISRNNPQSQFQLFLAISRWKLLFLLPS